MALGERAGGDGLVGDGDAGGFLDGDDGLGRCGGGGDVEAGVEVDDADVATGAEHVVKRCGAGGELGGAGGDGRGRAEGAGDARGGGVGGAVVAAADERGAGEEGGGERGGGGGGDA